MKTQFLPLQVCLGDAEHGEDLPVAVVLRVTDTLRARVTEAVSLMRSKNLQTVILSLEAGDTRWIRTVGYTNENTLAPIPGWMDADASICSPVDDVLEMDLSEADADFRSDCLVYENPLRPAHNAGGLRLAQEDPADPLGRGPSVCGVELDLQLVLQDWTVRTFIHRLDDLQDVFPGCAPGGPDDRPRQRS